MLRRIVVIAILISGATLAGCASVPMESKETSNAAKKFIAPSDGNAGLYIYRAGGFGGALKKDLWVDNNCVGESAPNVFFYEEVAGGKEHKIGTESEFSPNDLMLKTEPGKNYFVSQYIKIGVFVGGADLSLVDEKTGEEAVSKLQMAVKGHCSQQHETSTAKK